MVSRNGIILIILLVLILVTGCNNGGENLSDKEEIVSNQDDIRVDNGVFQLGDTWEVKDNWKISVDSVTEKKMEEGTPKEGLEDVGQVIIVKYSYRNLGYEGDIQDLFITPNKVQGDDKELGYIYPADTIKKPENIPIGGRCENVEEAFAFDKETGSVRISFELNDRDRKEQKAIFYCPVK